MRTMTGLEVLLITDETWNDDELLSRLANALGTVPARTTGVQLRDRRRSGRDLLALAERVAACCLRYEAVFLVNDRLDIARLVKADGVHLGGASVDVSDARAFLGADAIVTVAAHSIDDVERASRAQASAALVSPIFDTPNKGPARGVDFLEQTSRAAPDLALFALGGVDATRAAACVAQGAIGVAVVRAVLHASDPAAAMANLRNEVDRAKRIRAERSRAGRPEP